MVLKFRSLYDAPCRDSDVSCPEPSLAQQHLRDEVDINKLMERFKVTGQMPVGARVPEYGDYTGITDFRSAMDAVLRAQNDFMMLPAQVRARFGNSPQQFLEFASNPANSDELVKLGLATAKPDLGAAPKGQEGAPPPAKPAA